MAGIGFTRKKVESLTLGEKLRKLRGDFRITLVEASRNTKIQARYLEYLENGQYEKLPADVYVKGFLRSYARFLGVDEAALIKLYERERNIQANLEPEKHHSPTRPSLPISSLVITPRTIVLIVTALVVAGVFGYLYREFQSFAAEPRLVILEPAPGSIVETSEITLLGKTDKGARVSVNGEAVFVGGEGDFSEKLTLQSGLNTITIVSINRFEKQKTETLSLEAHFAESESPDSAELALRAQEQQGFFLEVSVKVPVAVTILADGTTVQNGPLKPGEWKRIEAKESILISSENGLETLVKGQLGQEEALGATKAPVKEIEFTAAGKTPKEGL